MSKRTTEDELRELDNSLDTLLEFHDVVANLYRNTPSTSRAEKYLQILQQLQELDRSTNLMLRDSFKG